MKNRIEKSLFDLLMHLHPAEHRNAYREEMGGVLEERLGQSRSPADRFLVWTREFTAILRHRRQNPSPRPGRNRNRVTMKSVATDLIGGIRSIGREPGLALVVAITLAMGVGSTTAIFSVVNGVLLEPLSVPDQDRLVTIQSRFIPSSGFDFDYFPLSAPEVLDYQEQTRTLQHVVPVSFFGTTVVLEDQDPARIRGVHVNGDFFDALKVEPALGRRFTSLEDVPDGRTIVISHGMWQTFFGGDSAVIGSSINLSGDTHEIVGVMPAGFAFPRGNTMIWAPHGLTRATNTANRSQHSLWAFGRMGDGVRMEQVETELQTLMAAWEDELPANHTGHFLVVEPLINDYIRSVRTPLVLLMGAVGLLLTIACVNIAGVLLAQAERRSGEFAVRTALGARRLRLLRQLLTEYTVLATIGSGLGVAFAYASLQGLTALYSAELPRAELVEIDGTVLGFSILLTVGTVLLFGMGPALHASRANLGMLLKDGSKSSSSRTRLRFRNSLIVCELALAVLLATGAGVLTRDLGQLLNTEPGIATEGRMFASIPLADSDPERAFLFYESLIDRLQADPRVIKASATTNVPFNSTPQNWDFRIRGREGDSFNGSAYSGLIVFAHSGFFETVGIELLRGRVFGEEDVVGGPAAMVINETMADMFWPGDDPIGRQVRVEDTWATVVGVVRDVRWEGLQSSPRPVRYVPQSTAVTAVPFMTRFQEIVIHTNQPDPLSLTGLLRRQVNELDPSQPIINIDTIDSAKSASLVREKFVTYLMFAFASQAVLLGAVGIFGVLSYSVGQRQKDISIRIALGAERLRVGRSVVLSSLALVTGGLTIGLLLALAGSNLLVGLLNATTPRDPGTMVTVALIMLAVAAAAAVVPAVRAVRTNPLDVLR